MEEIQKPFGFPDAQGFYLVHPSNRLALETARKVIEILPDKLEYLALSGYLIRDYPEGTPEADFDWKYHLLIGSGLSPNFSEATKAVEKAYQQARSLRGSYWHHGPLKAVTLSEIEMETRVAGGNIKELVPGSLIHSLVFSAVPIWEKPGLIKGWKEYKLTPFEYLQQLVFQFHNAKPAPEAAHISRVTGDEAERFIID